MSRVVGIDLGTTHTALAFAEEDGPIEVLDVPQLVARGTIEARPLLPSFLYLATAAERPLPLPWDDARGFAVGEYARARAVEAPGRVVASAKSWLCHSGIDRRTTALPLGSQEDDLDKVTPVEASWRYLEHLSEAYARRFGASLEGADVVLTVPASFDAAARELTVEAAFAAGLEHVTLLEEPQAALYAWIAGRGDAWRKELTPGDVLLVVDVGGGTTDFSAILATDAGGNLGLERVAVGDHILLGGDNMDLALAHVVRAKLDRDLDRWQMSALAFAARSAKERLLAEDAPASAPVAVASRGSKLVGSTLRADVTKDEARAVLVDGFFPDVPAAARPKARPRAALTELGLPYAHDPSVTAHLAAFLARHARPGEAMLRPTAVLFNGGVLKAGAIRARVKATIDRWLAEAGAPPVRELSGADLDLGVARGAAAYGLVRRGKGLRIRGGTARAYYVGIEGAAPAVPGIEPPLTAVCVAPFGMEEGTSAELAAELGVVVGEHVTFRFFGSSSRKDDAVGAEVRKWGELEELAPIHVTLPAEGRAEGDVVPVRLRSEVTAIGTLELEAVPVAPKDPKEKWKVELLLRAEDDQAAKP